MITSRAVCDRGEWVGLGLEDGTVRFFVPGVVPDGLPPNANAGSLGSEYPNAHAGPVTAVALLRRAIMEEPTPVQASLGCSASSDQTILVWDLRAGEVLHKLLTASRAPVTSLCLDLLPPRAAASGRLAG